MRKRKVLSSIMPCPDYRALVVLVLACFIWLVAALVDVEIVEAVGLLAIILAIVWSLLGPRVSGVLLFPILFVIFAIPVWFPLIPLLQNMTASVVYDAIRLIGIPAYLQNDVIVLPSGTLAVEGGCSGLNYFLASLTLGTLYAYLNYTSIRARLIMVAIFASAAVLANLLRVFVVVYVAYVTDMQHPLVRDHLMFGWYLFGGLIAFLLFIDTRLYRHIYTADDRQPKENVAAPVICNNSSVKHYLFMVVIACLLLSAGPVFVENKYQIQTGQPQWALPELPPVDGWHGPIQTDDVWSPVFHGAVGRKDTYRNNHAQVYLYYGYYHVQKQQEELINYRNSISGNEIWHSIYPRAKPMQLNGNNVLEQLMEKDARHQRLVWYWYHVAGYRTVNEYAAKALQVLGLLSGRSDASVTAVAVDNTGDLDSAREVLIEFISSMGNGLGSRR